MSTLMNTQVGRGALAARFENVRASYTEARARRRAYNQTISELSSLTDRELHDLGIARSGIRSLAMEAAQNV